MAYLSGAVEHRHQAAATMDCGDGDPWAAAAGEGEWNVRLGMNPNPPPLIPAWRPTATPPSPRARLGLAQSPFPALRHGLCWAVRRPSRPTGAQTGPRPKQPYLHFCKDLNSSIRTSNNLNSANSPQVLTRSIKYYIYPM